MEELTLKHKIGSVIPILLIEGRLYFYIAGHILNRYNMCKIYKLTSNGKLVQQISSDYSDEWIEFKRIKKYTKEDEIHMMFIKAQQE